MANIKYEHVTKTFGDVVAVSDLTLDIPDKEFLVFVVGQLERRQLRQRIGQTDGGDTIGGCAWAVGRAQLPVTPQEVGHADVARACGVLRRRPRITLARCGDRLHVQSQQD